MTPPETSACRSRDAVANSEPGSMCNHFRSHDPGGLTLMGWIKNNLGKPKADERPKGSDHTYTWSAWGDSDLAWQEERTCACGNKQTRNKRT